MNEITDQLLKILLRELRQDVENLASEIKAGNLDEIVHRATIISDKTSQMLLTVKEKI